MEQQALHITGQSTLSSEEIHQSLIRTVLYYDIFKYPVTATEIWHNCNCKNLQFHQVEEALQLLVKQKILFKHEAFYSVHNSQELIDKRLKANSRAQEVMRTKLKRYATLIARFPFVRAVFLSGSISKGSLAEDGDIDYFIVTKPGRLWLCRTLLILYKKLWLLNSHQYFCVNYFVDEEHLHIPDHNIFTATEAATLVPVYNYELYLEFMKQNNWVEAELPHHPIRSDETIVTTGSTKRKNMLEKALSGFWGERLDKMSQRITLWFWKRKFAKKDQLFFEQELRSKRSVSKHHPNGFQTKVLRELDLRISHFEQKLRAQLR